MQGQIDRHVQVVKALPDRAARAELAGPRADDLIIDAEFGNTRAFDPLRKKVAHVLAGNLRREPFEIVNRSALVAILLEELAQQLTELLLAHGLAQHTKDHRAFIKNNRLVSR